MLSIRVTIIFLSMTSAATLGAAVATTAGTGEHQPQVVEKRDDKGNLVERDVGDDAPTMSPTRISMCTCVCRW